MTDVELVALTEVVKAQRLCKEADNLSREHNGTQPAWNSDTDWPERDRLIEELERREIL